MMSISVKESYQAFLLLIGAALIGIFLYGIREILSPIVVFLAVLLIFLPLRANPAVRAVTGVLFLLFGIWFFSTLSTVLLPVIIAAMLAYILDPLIDYITRRRIPRLAAVLVVELSFLGIIALGFLILVPNIIHSFQDFNPAKISQDIRNWVDAGLIPWLESAGIPKETIQDFVDQGLSPKLGGIVGAILSGILNIGSGITVILGQVANLVIIPILLFYMMQDWDRIKKWVLRLFAPARREAARRYYKIVNGILSGYFRGALTIAVVNLVVVTTLLTVFGVPFSFVLGVISALLTLIPQFGVLITLVVTALVCLIGPNPVVHIILASITLLGENMLESSILYPKIVGDSLGLHPVALIASLVIFAYFFGFIGMLIAVPTTALLARLLEEQLAQREADYLARQLVE
ncbi:MAG: AI-2E family transporter [Chlorobi bacterium]|nr:AI-2E family transporter [Chlorobiota bacterium]